LLWQVLDNAQKGNQELVISLMPMIGAMLLRSLAMPFVLLWSVALLSSVAQGGMVFAPSSLQPKLERLSPTKNISNLFSMAGISRMLKSMLPVAAILYISYGIGQRDWSEIMGASRASVPVLLRWAFSRWYELAWKCGLVLLAWSGADYFFQRRQLNNSLKMTKQELVRETKDNEASQLMRGQIRKRRRELRKRWTMKDVERATAVITNPEHFAVALEYRPLTMTAPVVVAKGVDDVALRIKEAARWNNIPIVENPPLAQALFRATEVGEAIPAKLYMAVAEILAFLYRTQANLRNSMHTARSASGNPPSGSSAGMRN
jgi:flagellar biosynthesis protein FlhB